jgi:hypothetical protein
VGRCDRKFDEADAFVRAATFAFATGTSAPPAPLDGTWISRAHGAGVLLPVTTALVAAGERVPNQLVHLRMTVAAQQIVYGMDARFVASTLDGLGLEWALLKGPVLADVVFRTAHAREYTDLDVLVSPTDVDRAVRALCAAGAQLVDLDWEHVNRARTAELALRLPHGTVLDLHWSLLNLGRTRDSFRLSSDQLLTRRVSRQVVGASVSTLDDLDLVLHTSLHACLSGAHQLRWLLDVQQCLNWVDAKPSDLAGRAAELGIGPPVRAILESTATHLDPDVRPWANAMPSSPAWNALLQLVSRISPPSAPSASRRTARSWYAATRPTAVASVLAIGRTAALTARYARSGWPTGEAQTGSVDDEGYRRWVRNAERTATTSSGPSHT